MSDPKRGRLKGGNSHCQLCLEEKILVNSHIIPKFNFRKVKAGGSNYHLVSTDTAINRKKGQSELQEYLLCSKCDNLLLGRAEGYLAEFLFGRDGLSSVSGRGLVIQRTLEYGKLKKALLSILWRMHLSSLDFFRFVQLGEYHSDKIRRFLIDSKSLHESDYPILCAIPLVNGDFYSDWMLTPFCIRIDNNRVYHCVISGFIFSFVVGSAPLPLDIQHLSLKEEGSWIIGRDDVKKMPSIYELFLKSVEIEQKGTK